MSYRVVGGAGGNPLQIISYTYPATITASPPTVPTPANVANPPAPPPLIGPRVTSNTLGRAVVPANVNIAPRPPPLPLPKTFVSSGGVTNSPDQPGMSSISVKALTTPGQVTALRSAATNTAIAFKLPVKISADRATKLQQEEVAQALLVPPIVIDEVVIPK